LWRSNQVMLGSVEEDGDFGEDCLSPNFCAAKMVEFRSRRLLQLSHDRCATKDFQHRPRYLRNTARVTKNDRATPASISNIY
jgi:hypothetical protein